MKLALCALLSLHRNRGANTECTSAACTGHGPLVSPEVEPDGRVTFRLRAPAANEVTLRGEWVAAGGIDVSPPVAMAKDEQARNNLLFEQDLLHDIMPAFESRYNVAAGPKNRAIGGLSMGGMQALAMGLRHPDRFAWIGVFSPVTEPDIPQRYAEQLAKPDAINKQLSLLWVGCGSLDNLFSRTKAVDEVLTSSGIKHEFHPAEGSRHSWVLWRANLAEMAQRVFR